VGEDAMNTLVEDLLRVEAYEPRPASVELAETHVSWVFLTDREAYKVKRPVSLGFLDFSTIEARRRACEAEVRLNARLSPDVYLGVVPIVRGKDGRARVAAGAGARRGEIVDWAVRMHRLPDSQRADDLLAAGRLEAREVDEIAAEVARFHGAAADGPEAARYGAREALEASVEENFAQTRGALEAHVGEAEAKEIRDRQRAFLHDSGALLARRVAAGRIRDGHGDLRLEHVYLLPDEGLRIIDCIEFNDRFRYGDVCADVAFLAMDLAWHGRVDLAERLLATYAREADDYDLYAVADFYESYRAFVRGKVATILEADEHASPELRARAAGEARRYFLLTLSSGRRAVLGPAVIAVGGLIASGKSTVADRLSLKAGGPAIDADRTRKRMLGKQPLERMNAPAWAGAYDPRFTERVYAEVLRRAGVVLDSGRPVVLDASFRSREMRAAARGLARAHGVPFRFVECRASEQTARARLAAREKERGVSDGRLAIFDAFAARFEPVTELPASEHVVVHTEAPMETLLADVGARIPFWPPGT
jgi:aminoglycoside phosphotransferase family enzyme/predicted kinase